MISSLTIITSTVLLLSGYENNQTSMGLENMAQTLRGDVRLVVLGDSFSAPYFARVPPAGLLCWPIPNISALGGGATINSSVITTTPLCSPVSKIISSDTLGYKVERSTSSNSYFTLPTFGLQEIYTSDTFNDLGNNRLFSFQQPPTGKLLLGSGLHGHFAREGDNLLFRFLYRCPSDPLTQVEEVNILDSYQNVGTIQLRNGARPLWHLGEDPNNGTRDAVPRQINASAVDFPANNSTTGYLSMILEQVSPLASTNLYFEPAGGVYYHIDEEDNRKPGLYYNQIADGSWSFFGFGCDTEGAGTHDKKFSLEQFTYWLDVGTLERTQPTVFMWYLAPENLSYSNATLQFTNMIEQADEAANLVGLTSVEHFIVISHLIEMWQHDSESVHQLFMNQQNAAYDLAAMHSNISAASIYAATDKTLFTGAKAVPWLIEHGFDNFEYGNNYLDLPDFSNGDLLDLSNVHPKGVESAAFYAAILGDIIRDAGCPADLKPDGLIDIEDLLLLINGWGADGIGDINNDGTTDITDLLFLFNDWGECWPVQAPFNTPAFRGP